MDESKLTPANENPWYILMTLYGEQEGEWIDGELAEKNRRLWNAWICQGMDEAERVEIAEQIGIEVEETEWNEKKNLEVRSRFAKRTKDTIPDAEVPDPDKKCILTYTFFSSLVYLNKSILTGSSFGHSRFFREVYFDSTYWSSASFRGAQFDDESIFDDAAIGHTAIFSDAVFHKHASFNSVSFGAVTFLEKTHFGARATFANTEFGKLASFEGAIFGEVTSFDGASFAGTADFRRALSIGLVSFKGYGFDVDDTPQAHFGTHTLFSEAHFKGRVDFYQRRFGPPEDKGNRTETLTFANAIFEAPVSFEGAVFPDLMPILSNTTLPPSTRISAKNALWPEVHFGWRQGHTKAEQAAEPAKESAAGLRHAMNRQSLPEEEHFFFTREMHHAGRIGGWFARLPYRLFGLVSGYGGSIERPTLGLIWLFIAPLGVYLAALGLSFASIFKFFGFQRIYFVEELQKADHWVVPVLASTQTVLAFILLFFLGLGLRTRFRLR